MSATKVGAQFFVGDFGELSIALLTNGRFVVVWLDNTVGETTQGDIKAQIFNPDGSEWSAEVIVNTITSNIQRHPVVSALPGGGFVVAWEDNSETSGSLSNSDVRGQIMNGNGTKIGPEFLVNTNTANVDDFPAIATLADGRFVVTWYSFTDVDAQIFDVLSSGASKSGGEIHVETTFREDQSDPSIAVLTGGRFVVAWTDDAGGGGDGSGAGIRAQIFTSTGAKSGPEFIVNTATTNDQDEPAVAPLSDGRFLIVWEDNSRVTTEFNQDIRAQIFNADGSRFGGEFIVNTTTLSSQSNPVVAALGNGRFVVGWDSTEVTAQVFNSDGSKWGAEFIANTTTGNRQDIGAIAALGPDQFVISWRDFGNQLGVNAQIFSVPPIDESPHTLKLNQAKPVAENATRGTVVGSLSAIDPDGDAVTFALLGSVGGRFTLVGNQLRVANGLLLDFEQASSHSISVRAKDPAGNFVDRALTVSVGNVTPDVVNGDAAANTFVGGSGNDTLRGNGGNDRLRGNSGNDRLDGGTGTDRLEGGTGNDIFVINSTADVLTDTGGIDTVHSTATKTLGSGFEKLTLFGTASIHGSGNTLANVIIGNSGNNTLSGLGGNDELVGGSGSDRLVGGLGKDTMTGGAARDIFDFNSITETGKTTATRDLIRDFSHLIDDIDLSTIDANGSAAGNGAFTLLRGEGAAFTGVKGQLRFDQQNLSGSANDRTIVEGDINGDRVADFQIQLSGLKTLTVADFAL